MKNRKYPVLLSTHLIKNIKVKADNLTRVSSNSVLCGFSKINIINSFRWRIHTQHTHKNINKKYWFTLTIKLKQKK